MPHRLQSIGKYCSDILHTIGKYIVDTWDAILSYFAASLGLLSTVDPMEAGGYLLLIIRLIVDIPKAYRVLTGKPEKKKRNE